MSRADERKRLMKVELDRQAQQKVEKRNAERKEADQWDRA